MPDERAERLAENESRFREINDRVERDLERIVYSPQELLRKHPETWEIVERSGPRR